MPRTETAKRIALIAAGITACGAIAGALIQARLKTEPSVSAPPPAASQSASVTGSQLHNSNVSNIGRADNVFFQAPASIPATETPIPTKRFTHPRWGYDCSIPDSWIPASGGDNLAAIPFFHRDNSAVKILATGNHNDGDPIEAAIASSLASSTELSRRTQTLHLYGYQDGEITRKWDSFPGQIVDYISGPERIRSLFIVPPDKGRVIRIQLYAPIDIFDRYTKEFERVLESVRVFNEYGG